ncbi:hypothetical protein K470DRAFT_256266 [Piedraia hortae CBS 480.64]|uniref:Probable 26S proteasome regulatory subunit p27 n=1 Tax=Piedraia hortae CBS 480.64 TaxID=1314780 RepID=A0A6A7C3C1_9PEZI|nr:hypothetical protein K470DRAFT_256266 [Piedraia hortae CBS 480.64]
MTTPLVDSEGYPRADIDVAKIRIARARIIRLQNDYKKVMDKLKVAVEDAFASAETASETDTESIVPSSAAAAHGSVPSETTNGHSDADIPFAVVDEVSEGGPAAAAGLKVGDKVTAFGSVDWTKADKFKLIQAEVMKNPPNVAIVVKIMRMDKKEDVMITPKSDWGGRGSLGCHLKPL